MVSRIFIDRPIFAWVIAIVIMLAGAGSITALSVEQYPDIAILHGCEVDILVKPRGRKSRFAPIHLEPAST